jgi:hypothetical protein
MTTLAGMAFGETPERVLKRVQQLEDVELPSLPSFSHDMDYDSEVDQTEDERSVEQADKSEAVCILVDHMEFSLMSSMTLRPHIPYAKRTCHQHHRQCRINLPRTGHLSLPSTTLLPRHQDHSLHHQQ